MPENTWTRTSETRALSPYVVTLAAATVLVSSAIGFLITTNPVAGAALSFVIAFPAVYKFRKAFIMGYAAYLPFEELFLKYAPDQLYPLFRYGAEATIFLIFVVVVGENILRGRGWRRTKIDLPIFVLAGAVLASTVVNSVPPAVAALGVKSVFRYVFLFFIITQSDYTRKDLKVFLSIFIASGVLQIFAGLVQMVGGEYVYDFFRPKDIVVGEKILRVQDITLSSEGLRVCGTLLRYGVYGNYIALLLCLPLARRYVCNDKGLVTTATILLGAMVLVASFSRKGWVAMYLAFIYMNWRCGRKVKTTALLGLPLMVVPFLIVYYGFAGSLSGEVTSNPIERFIGMFSPDYLSHTLERTRLYILTYVTYRIARDFFWFGVGPGLIGSDVTGTASGTSAFVEVDRISGLDFADERLALLTDVGFVNIFAQIGFFGLLAFIVMLSRFIKQGKMLLMTGKDAETRTLSLMFLGFIVIMIVETVLGSAFTYRAVSFYFWLFAGLLFSKGMAEDPAPGKASA
ncbi:MAG: O-antigen ligase family protein [Deltaproteobacteria bacterium]|nr:O-antigen ligase family protein [Deltaproteobacteria bacterium]